MNSWMASLRPKLSTICSHLMHDWCKIWSHHRTQIRLCKYTAAFSTPLVTETDKVTRILSMMDTSGNNKRLAGGLSRNSSATFRCVPSSSYLPRDLSSLQISKTLDPTYQQAEHASSHSCPSSNAFLKQSIAVVGAWRAPLSFIFLIFPKHWVIHGAPQAVKIPPQMTVLQDPKHKKFDLIVLFWIS